jgi:hypothetical protein
MGTKLASAFFATSQEGQRRLPDRIGTSRLPIRFRAKPELPVLELAAWSNASH